jgi:hypothetical protein
MLKLMGDPEWAVKSSKPKVLDIDPNTTDYVYTGQFPRFLEEIDATDPTVEEAELPNTADDDPEG